MIDAQRVWTDRSVGAADKGTDRLGESADKGWLYEELTPREREEAKLLAGTLTVEDAASVVRFGGGIQQEIADFAATVLGQVRTQDAGDLGASISELVDAIHEASRDDDEERKRLLASIPAVGRLLNRVRRSANRSRTIEVQVEAIRAKLDEAYIAMHRDIELLDLALKHNYDYFRKLDVHISAAQLRLKRAVEEELPALSVRVEQGGDDWDAQRVNELQAFIRRLELRLDDFRRTRYLSLSQAPRIRLLQQSGQIMMEKIQAVVYHLIPLWQMDLVTGIAQHRAERALAVQERVRAGIEASMRQSAERTRSVAVGIARDSEAGILGMDTLRSVHTELLATLEETVQVYEDGRKRRVEAETELLAMEQELKRRLAELTDRPLQ